MYYCKLKKVVNSNVIKPMKNKNRTFDHPVFLLEKIVELASFFNLLNYESNFV